MMGTPIAHQLFGSPQYLWPMGTGMAQMSPLGGLAAPGLQPLMMGQIIPNILQGVQKMLYQALMPVGM
jgi:hypothetical protein